MTAHIESAWPKHPGYVIDAVPLEGTGRARWGDVVLAESDRCLVVKESDHLDQLYFPLDDICWEHLVATEHRTICPFKGEASYWTATAGTEQLDDVLWSYPEPFSEVAALAGHAAFYTDRVDVTVTERWSDEPGDASTKRFPVWGTAADLVRLMDVQPAGEGRFVAPTHPDPPLGTFFDWAEDLVERNVVEGGQLLGDVVVAAAKAVPDKRVRSAYAVFARAATFDEPLDVGVEVLRDGRTIGVADVRITQRGALCCAGTVMLDAGAPDLIRSGVPMPDVAGPYESPPLDMAVLGRDLREVDGCYRARAPEVGPPEVHVWVRYRDQPDEAHLVQALLAQPTTHWTIGAAMRPHEGITEAEAHHTISTAPLSVAIAFHDPADVREWMLYSNPAVYAGNGSVHGEGRVHARDGRLLATYSVQAMVRAFTAPPGDPQRAM